ncbi:hypothetical protein ACFL35_07775 [Candidatus Riflebacteria bacterium]
MTDRIVFVNRIVLNDKSTSKFIVIGIMDQDEFIFFAEDCGKFFLDIKTSSMKRHN